MVSLAPEWVVAGSFPAKSVTVLVAEPDAEPLVAISEELIRQGFAVIPVTTWSAALTVIAEQSAHIAVVHACLVDFATVVGSRPGAALSADRNATLEIPIIFTVGDAGTFDWESYALLDGADYVLAPISMSDLGQRVSTLARRLKRRATASLEADQLRQAVRRVSVEIQSTNDPSAIAVLLVNGIADVFRVDRVCFSTFGDDGVAPRTLERRCSRAKPVPVDLGEHQASVQALAARLWRAGEAADLAEPGPDDTSDGYPELAGWEASGGERTFLAVPLGNSTTTFALLWVTAADDRRTWSAMELSLLSHLAGVATQAMMQARIITGQREVLKRLQRLDDAKSNFLRTVNHELRTPLTSLTAYLDLIKDGAGGELPPAALKMLAIVERNAQRLGLLVDDVLTISRMTANPEVDWKRVNIPQVVTGVVQALGEAAESKGVQVEVNHAASDLVVDGDAARLHQLFRNITDNAIKFTPAGGSVAVDVGRCVLNGSVAAISVVVADTGDGITAEDRPELFTTFFRGANAEADAVSGSGLGLTIARGVVDAHRGTIEVSDTVGGGTTISVQLPVQHQPAE